MLIVRLYLLSLKVRRSNVVNVEMVVSKTLADRVQNSSGCGLVFDRDLNAACNILKRVTIGGMGINVVELF